MFNNCIINKDDTFDTGVPISRRKQVGYHTVDVIALTKIFDAQVETKAIHNFSTGGEIKYMRYTWISIPKQMVLDSNTLFYESRRSSC